jgi:Flp pilus assembly protein TadD
MAATGKFMACAAALVLGACAQLGAGPAQLASSDPAKAAEPDTRSDLAKATEYWGKEYSKNQRDPQAALSYARNLKAMGEKRQALTVLQQSSMFNATDRGINSEYGRLALELDQVNVAQKLLEAADDPASPDWKIVSARGTVMAKQGRYREAIPFYERALALAPNQTSILNNLALAHAMEGNAEKAEPLLKRAAATGSAHDARVTQNLALVLGLQGKYDEAKLAAARDLPADNVASNVDFMQRMVKIEAKPLAKVADAPAARAELKGPAADQAGSGWAAQVAVVPSAR